MRLGAGVGDSRSLLTNGFERRVDADFQHTRDITNAGANDCHRYNHPANFRAAALIGVVGNKLAKAVVTAIALLAWLACAIFLIAKERHLGQAIALYCAIKAYLDRCCLLYKHLFSILT